MTAIINVNGRELSKAVESYSMKVKESVRVFGSQMFVRQVQVYLTREIDRALKDNGGIPEGATAIVRGQTWRGWARKSVKKYGQIIVEGTRFYHRKFRMGGPDRHSVLARQHRHMGAPLNAETIRHRRKVYAGTLNAKQHRAREANKDVASRSFERVWRRRASGAYYSPSSKLMQDTGALRQSIRAMRVTMTVGGKRLEFRPGTSVRYFDRQNTLRPLWVWHEPVDMPVVAGFAEKTMTAIIAGKKV